jgi:hypothetical protein
MRITIHHRLPDGDERRNNPENKSEVTLCRHRAYNLLIGVFSAPEQARRFEYRYNLWGDNRHQTPEQQERIQNWLNGITQSTHEKGRAGLLETWRMLFPRMTCAEMLADLNSIWNDPAYIFYEDPVEGPDGIIMKIGVQKTIITRQPAAESLPQPQHTRILIPTSIRQWQPRTAQSA